MSIYDDLKPVVNELMAEFKQGVITVTEENIPPRPVDLPTWENWNPIKTVRVYELDAVAKAAGPRGAGASLANGDTVRADDYIVTCADVMWLTSVNGVAVPKVQAPLDVSLLQTMRIDGLPGTVLAMTPTPGAGTKLVHKFIYRR